MTRLIYLATLLLACLSAAAQPDKHVALLVKACITSCEKAEYNKLPPLFDKSVKEYITEDAMSSAWKMITRSTGHFIAIDSMVWGKNPQVPYIIAFCNFKKSWVALQFPYSPRSHKLLGMFSLKIQPKHTEKEHEIITDDGLKHIQVLFSPGSDLYISGELTVPKDSTGRLPVAIIVHGSGPMDMDGSIGPNKIYKDLAEGLSKSGIAVLRYNKRTYLYPDLFKDSFTLEEEVLLDAEAAFAYVRQLPFADTTKIFIIGHSLGAMCAPLIGSRIPVSGLIMMAAPSGGLEDILPYQFRYLSTLKESHITDSLVKLVSQQCQRVKDGAFSASTPASELPLGLPASYWQYLRNYKQVQTASALNTPIFVLNGESDYQVPMQEFGGWQNSLKNRNNVTFQSYPGLSHLFMPASRKPGPKDYESPAHVSKNVVNDIAAWVRKQP